MAHPRVTDNSQSAYQKSFWEREPRQMYATYATSSRCQGLRIKKISNVRHDWRRGYWQDDEWVPRTCNNCDMTIIEAGLQEQAEIRPYV